MQIVIVVIIIVVIAMIIKKLKEHFDSTDSIIAKLILFLLIAGGACEIGYNITFFRVLGYVFFGLTAVVFVVLIGRLLFKNDL